MNRSCNGCSLPTLFLDIDVDKMCECRRVASLPASSILQWYDSLKTITSKFHFDFRFLEFWHDNRRLFPGSSKFIQSCFKHVSRFCMLNAVRQTVPLIYCREEMRQSVSHFYVCPSLKLMCELCVDYSDSRAVECINNDLVNTLCNLVSRCAAKALNPQQIFPVFDLSTFNHIALESEKDIIDNLYKLAGWYLFFIDRHQDKH